MRYPLKKEMMCQHQNAVESGFFAFQCRLLMTKQCTHVAVAIEKSDALTDKPARELARGITGTRQTG